MHPNHAGVALLRPTADLPLFLAQMRRRWPTSGPRRVARGQRRLRARHLSTAPGRGPAASARHPRHRRRCRGRSTGWTGQPQRDPDARLLRSRGEVAVTGAPASNGCGTSPSASTPADVAVVPLEEALAERDQRRLVALGIARPRLRRRGRRARRGRGHRGRRGGSTPPRRRPASLRGPHRAALAVRPADPRPGARRGAVRLRVHARDVQAGRRSAAGATSRCRCCTTTGSSASSTPAPTARPACSGSTPCTRRAGGTPGCGATSPRDRRAGRLAGSRRRRPDPPPAR